MSKPKYIWDHLNEHDHKPLLRLVEDDDGKFKWYCENEGMMIDITQEYTAYIEEMKLEYGADYKVTITDIRKLDVH